jgi:glycosyltransferase involved in cell wall biosynthesis
MSEMKPMNVAVVIPLPKGGSGGVAKHIIEVVPRWLRSGRVKSVTIFSPGTISDELKNLGARIQHVSPKDHLSGFREMGQAVDDGGFDIALSISARSVRVKKVPLITMLQNAEPLQRSAYDMTLLWRLRLFELRREYRVACRRATHVIAVSDYVKEQARVLLGVPPEKMDVIYHGITIDHSVKPVKPTLPLPPEFIFCAGSLAPYRGFEDIIRALAVVRQRTGQTMKAVLAGGSIGMAKFYEDRLRNLVHSLKVDDCIIWAGQLQRSEMAWCYENARFFVQMSRAEACPNIVMEAMGHGCLNISCDQPPMPEIYGDAALIYPKGDAERLADAIITATRMDPATVEEWKRKALYRSSQFSWETIAEATLQLLERIRNQQARIHPA